MNEIIPKTILCYDISCHFIHFTSLYACFNSIKCRIIITILQKLHPDQQLFDVPERLTARITGFSRIDML